jgi:hypothetical protein
MMMTKGGKMKKIQEAKLIEVSRLKASSDPRPFSYRGWYSAHFVKQVRRGMSAVASAEAEELLLIF